MKFQKRKPNRILYYNLFTILFLERGRAKPCLFSKYFTKIFDIPIPYKFCRLSCRISKVSQKMFGSLYPALCQIIGKGHPKFFFKQKPQISRMQIDFGSYCFQRYRICIMLFNPFFCFPTLNSSVLKYRISS